MPACRRGLRSRINDGITLCVQIQLCALICIALALAGAWKAEATAVPTKPHLTLSGTFLQIDGSIAAWNVSDWEREFDWIQAAGMDLIIVQYAGYGGSWWYPHGDTGARDVIGHVIREAEERSMGVILGLHLDPAFWSGRLDVEEAVATNRLVADELFRRYGGSPSFAGWYIPHELSDLTFARKDQFDQAVQALGAIARHLRDLAPAKPVTLAPYFGKYLYPREFAEKWADFLDSVPVDVVMLQDGVGTHRVDVEDIRPYYSAVARAIRGKTVDGRAVELWSDVEVFDQIHGWPVDDSPWAAVPADLDRVLRQMEAASPYVSRLVIFEFSHYMSPRRKEAATLYESYLKWLAE